MNTDKFLKFNFFLNSLICTKSKQIFRHPMEINADIFTRFYYFFISSFEVLIFSFLHFSKVFKFIQI